MDLQIVYLVLDSAVRLSVPLLLAALAGLLFLLYAFIWEAE